MQSTRVGRLMIVLKYQRTMQKTACLHFLRTVFLLKAFSTAAHKAHDFLDGLRSAIHEYRIQTCKDVQNRYNTDSYGFCTHERVYPD